MQICSKSLYKCPKSLYIILNEPKAFPFFLYICSIKAKTVLRYLCAKSITWQTVYPDKYNL